MPPVIEFNHSDEICIRNNLPTLQKMGIGLEQFGSATYKLDSLPDYLTTGEPESLIREIIDELQPLTAGNTRQRPGEKLIIQTLCHLAVDSSKQLSETEQHQLVEDLLTCDLPYCDPKGRPTLIQYSHNELQRKFGRK